jgi:hypothetical protein
MNDHSPSPYDIRRFCDAQQCILEQRSAKSLALESLVYGQPTDNYYRYRVWRILPQLAWRPLVLHGTSRQTVVPNHNVPQ